MKPALISYSPKPGAVVACVAVDSGNSSSSRKTSFLITYLFLYFIQKGLIAVTFDNRSTISHQRSRKDIDRSGLAGVRPRLRLKGRPAGICFAEPPESTSAAPREIPDF
jgi:hypothetical protein